MVLNIVIAYAVLKVLGNLIFIQNLFSPSNCWIKQSHVKCPPSWHNDAQRLRKNVLFLVSKMS